MSFRASSGDILLCYWYEWVKCHNNATCYELGYMCALKKTFYQVTENLNQAVPNGPVCVTV